jgi:signal transduction histidine kinase
MMEATMDETSQFSNLPSAAARELGLHDRTIQSLFGLGLQIEACSNLIEASPAQAREGLARALNSLNGVISELRLRINELARLD